MSEYDFMYKGTRISPVQLQKGILGVESSYGYDNAPRYEPAYHKDMLANAKTKMWIPTPAERRVIKERGYDKATKDFSTSRGPYQIIPETAYRYTSFAGNPEDLEGPESYKVWLELMARMHRLSGGDLEKAIPYWNKNPNYIDRLEKAW